MKQRTVYVSGDVEAMSCITLYTEKLQFSEQTEPAKCAAMNSTLGMTCSPGMCWSLWAAYAWPLSVLYQRSDSGGS